MKYLIIPGLHGSGDSHWQTKWQQSNPQLFKRVEQHNWDIPDRLSWINTLNEYVEAETDPVILIAHSLGCIAVAHWAYSFHSSNVAGALLVAPADVERSSQAVFRSFAPVPCTRPFPFKTIVVASENDQYVEMKRLNFWSAQWNADLINVGLRGHINADSGVGFWDEGYEILEKFSGIHAQWT